MLFETALDLISDFAATTARLKISALLARLKRGEDLDVALILEATQTKELNAIYQICEYRSLRDDPILLAELIEAAYRTRASSPAESRIAWTGPKLDRTIKSTRTGIAARAIVDDAEQRLLIAGYHVTSRILEDIGVWAAVARNVVVSIMTDGNDLDSAEANIFRAKGVRLYEIRAAAGDYSKFHVKAIVADGRSAMVGSANFTSLGHGSNIELGLIVDGNSALMLEKVLNSYLLVAASTGWLISN